MRSVEALNFNPEQDEVLPLGESKKLEAEKETLPAVEVQNRVVWINPSFSETIPFKLELDKPTPLGVFFTPKESGDRNIEVQAGHHRSGLIGRVIFKDNEGRIYRDVDLKGLGHIGWGVERRALKQHLIRHEELEDKSTEMSVQPVQAQDSGGSFGITGRISAEKNRDMEEKFLELGIPTSRTISIIERLCCTKNLYGVAIS